MSGKGLMIRTYANTLQGIYDDRTGGFHSFVGVLVKFGKELLAQDRADHLTTLRAHLTTLRAEVQSRCDEEWKEYEVYENREGPFGIASQYRALGKARAFAEVLDLIDKHTREGQ